MQLPTVKDTIVAVSSGWQASPLGILRLSGPAAFKLTAQLGAGPALRRGGFTHARLRVACTGEAGGLRGGRGVDASADQSKPQITAPDSAPRATQSPDAGTDTLPATILWFPAPHSYTGQDVVEIHTVGCLPLLRELSARLITWGARRALPGEFTARAFVCGKLDAGQVESVLTLMQTEQEAAVRQAARLAREEQRKRLSGVATRLTDLLALIEAGIDFVEEEDVRLIGPAEVVRRIDGLVADLGAVEAGRGERRAGLAHVALVGLPNAGKSTLFNALVGYERAIVSPVLGTTRDVLSAEVEVAGQRCVLQDCAGLGATVDDLDAAAHLAAERAAEQADVVVWVHAADEAWDARETAALERIGPERRLVVWSKAELARDTTRDAECGAPPATEDEANPGRSGAAGLAAREGAVAVSVATGAGLPELRARLARAVERVAAAPPAEREADVRNVMAALGRARRLVAESPSAAQLRSPELVALELRAAHDALDEELGRPLDEAILERVMTQFCVGK